MNCIQIREKLIDYVCQEIDISEADMIEHHLQSCPVCREELGFLKSIRETVCHEEMPSFGEHYWESFVVEVHQKIECPRRRVFPLWAIPAVAAASLAIIIGVGYLLTTKAKKETIAKEPYPMADSGLIKNIQALPPAQVESIIRLIVDRQEVNRSLWDLGDVEPNRFRQLVKEQMLLERSVLRE